MNNTFNLSICQMNISNNKEKNIETSINLISKASKNGSDIIVLPEMFICPYDTSLFKQYSEEQNGNTLKIISEIAREKHVYIVAGSIPEKSDDKIYNTCFVFNREGKIIARHRKIHLFDVDIENKSSIRFMESDTLFPGNSITTFDTEFCKVGIAICYDIRFHELFRAMALKGVELVIVPASFNMVSGPAHWESLIRIRSVDNQIYVAGAASARDTSSTYVSYANSLVSDPWGDIISNAGIHEEIIHAKIDLEYLKKVRSQLPLLIHRKPEIYK